jgi:hypothetical protein
MFIRKIIAIFLGGIALLAVGTPLGLYWLGLSNVEGRPEPPTQMREIAADTALLGQYFNNESPIVVRVLNPWSYLGEMRPVLPVPRLNGSHAVWIIVRNYNGSHLRNHRGIWWHLSGAALTIWVTRNWTTDQIVTAAAAISRSWPKQQCPGGVTVVRGYRHR